MKISRIRHVVITCIIFLIVIAVIITIYNGELNKIKENTQELVFRVVATEDIIPGDIINDKNVKLVQMQNVTDTANLVYRLESKNDILESVAKTEEYRGKLSTVKTAEEAEAIRKQYKKDDNRWAIGKIATAKIYKGETLVADDLRIPSEYVGDNERIYSIPFDSLTTGGYNVKVSDKVDICVLYNDDKDVLDYQNLDKNKVIDIVLSKKEIVDIRDESGNSKKTNAAVVPGYICFKLTYDEINKIELAKRQGKVFVGIADAYSEDAHPETFMQGTKLPTFLSEVVNP